MWPKTENDSDTLYYVVTLYCKEGADIWRCTIQLSRTVLSNISTVLSLYFNQHFLIATYPYHGSFLDLFFFYSCEIGSRAFAKFDKLAEKVNVRDDVKLAHVNCDADDEFCSLHDVIGK